MKILLALSLALGPAVAAAPVTLTVLEDVPAGSIATQAVTRGAAIKIMTGAPIPDGCEAVIPVENVTVEGTKISLPEKWNAPSIAAFSSLSEPWTELASIDSA